MMVQKEIKELEKKIIAALKKPEMEGFTGMSVNERLFVSGLMDDFDKYKKSNKKHAKFILEKLKVDQDSIIEILK